MVERTPRCRKSGFDLRSGQTLVVKARSDSSERLATSVDVTGPLRYGRLKNPNCWMAMSAEYRSTFVAFTGYGDVSKWVKQTLQFFLCLIFFSRTIKSQKEKNLKNENSKDCSISSTKPFTAKYSPFSNHHSLQYFSRVNINDQELVSLQFFLKSILTRYHQKY